MHAAAFADSDFSGVWTASVCPSGTKDDPARCSQFVLELFQKQDKLCGSHTIATPDAAQMDGGSGPSLTGSITGDTAAVTVASMRAAAPVQAELKMANGKLRWHRLDKPRSNELLPANAHFVKSRAKTLLNPVFAQQLSAACAMISTQPADHAPPPPATTPPHERMRTMQKTGLADNRVPF